MKRIVIMRHGEAGVFADSDFQRALTKAGVSMVMAAAQCLISIQAFPQSIVSSPARRTSETTQILCEAMKLSESLVQYAAGLYAPGVDAYLSEIFAQPTEIESLMIIGHNPSISLLVNLFLTNCFVQIPPGGFVVVDFDTDQWSELFVSGAKIVHHYGISLNNC